MPTGTLKVHHVKTLFPRALLGRFHSIFGILQQLSLVLQLLLAMLIFNYPGTLPRSLYSLLSSVRPTQSFDVIFMDQQSFGVPWLKIMSRTRVVFYCHFPDKDISNSIAKQAAIARGHSGPSALRAIYRVPLNLVEEGTIGEWDVCACDATPSTPTQSLTLRSPLSPPLPALPQTTRTRFSSTPSSRKSTL